MSCLWPQDDMKLKQCYKLILPVVLLMVFSSCTAKQPDRDAGLNTAGVLSTPAQTDEHRPTAEVFHPKKPLDGLKICIDAGHQERGNPEKEQSAPWGGAYKAKCTTGACGNFTGAEESVVNLKIALLAEQKLTALGAEICMIRQTQDVDISNRERAECANRFGAQITLRIHCNSADTQAANGIELYVRGSGDGTAAYKKRSDDDYLKAEELLDSILKETGAASRGVKRSDEYTGINWCNQTCIIIECGFLSNEKEDRLLSTDGYQQKIVDGIVNYFISSR